MEGGEREEENGDSFDFEMICGLDGFGLLGWYNISIYHFINDIKGVKCKRHSISFIFDGHQNQNVVISSAWRR